MLTTTTPLTAMSTFILALTLFTTTLALPQPFPPRHLFHQRPLISVRPLTNTSRASLSIRPQSHPHSPACGEPGILTSINSKHSAALTISPISGIPSAPDCATHCLEVPTCLSYSYTHANGSCSLYSVGVSEMGVQGRPGGAVFWWDRECLRDKGDVVESQEEQQGVSGLLAQMDDGKIAAWVDAALLETIKPTENHIASALTRRSFNEQAVPHIHDSVSSAQTGVVIDDAVADLFKQSSTSGQNEASHSSDWKSNMDQVRKKAWPYGVGAVKADDFGVTRSWTRSRQVQWQAKVERRRRRRNGK